MIRRQWLALAVLLINVGLTGPALASGENEFHFTGTVASLPGTPGFLGDWVVSGRTAHVAASTIIDQREGSVGVGAVVDIEGGLRTDGSIDAAKIEVQHSSGGGGGSGDFISFYGTVTSLPSGGLVGDWVVNNQTVRVSASTTIDQENGAVAVGALVEVEGNQQTGGIIAAMRIEVEQSAGGGGGGSGMIEFFGTISALPSTPGFIGDWSVGSKAVHVHPTTTIDQEHGSVAVGATVEVHGNQLTDGSVDAARIEVKQSGGGGSAGFIRLEGTISSLPSTQGLVGDWTVSGKTVHVSATTLVNQEHGAVAVGAAVEVEGNQRMDGSIDATRIEVKSNTGGPEHVDFTGAVQTLPAGPGLVGDWTVAGRTVHVTASTVINTELGSVVVGAVVEVEGTPRTDGSVDASSVEVRHVGGGGDGGYIEFFGNVTSLPAQGLIGDWVVNGQTVHVRATTVIDQEHGTVSVGAYVEVKGNRLPDNSVDAVRIEVKQSSGSSGGLSDIFGTISSLPSGGGLVGDWAVSGKTVHVAASTLVDQEHGAIAIGAMVEVKGNLRSDGSIDAVRIEVKNGSGGGGTPGSVRFYGPIGNLPSTTGWLGDWLVGGQTVHVTSATIISTGQKTPAVGMIARVEGKQRPDHSVDASRVMLKENSARGNDYIKFSGAIGNLPASGLVGDWMVGGRVVHVTASTTIKGKPGSVAVGNSVQVEGSLQPDGSVNASKIKSGM